MPVGDERGLRVLFWCLVPERLPALLLAVLLGAGSALAQEQVETGPVPEVPPETEFVEAEEIAWEPGYQEIPRTGSEWTEGGLSVSVAAGVLRPPHGYMPVDVMVHNLGSTPRAVHIGFTPDDARIELVTKEVEVGPRQRLVTWLPVPVSMRHGTIRLRGPGVAFQPFRFFSLDPVGSEPVLVLGTEQVFQAGTGLPRMERRPMLAVRFVSPEDAPGELAAYVGHAEVVVAEEVTALSADAWTALEAYAATGGLLALVRPPRDMGAHLPLLATTTPGIHPYGFGQVRLCQKPDDCGPGVLSDVGPRAQEVRPRLVAPAAPAPRWEPVHLLKDGGQPLLPQVQAPVGRFLLFISLFVLAVGLGGLILARRKGLVVLLIAVPSVALVTCLAGVAWLVLSEGFSIQASRYSLTWLDRARNRAVTVGVAGYFAPLSPDGVRVPVLGALLAPDVEWDARALEADWTNGMVVKGGFLRARTYREWAEVAVVPTQARFVVRREGNRLRVRNALGAPLAAGYVRLGAQVWEVPALSDDAEAEAVLAPESAEKVSFESFARFAEPVHSRFSGVPWAALGQPLPEGTFLAKLSGSGLAPTSVLPVELHEGLHFVHGQVDGP
jgi:hypothetical protein